MMAVWDGVDSASPRSLALGLYVAGALVVLVRACVRWYRSLRSLERPRLCTCCKTTYSHPPITTKHIAMLTALTVAFAALWPLSIPFVLFVAQPLYARHLRRAFEKGRSLHPLERVNLETIRLDALDARESGKRWP